MKPLVAESFVTDPRVVEARRLIAETLVDHQRKIQEPREADPERKVAYEQLLREFSEMRGGPLYYPYMGSGIGNGPLVELADGSVKFDFISGIGVHYLGHSHPRLLEAGLGAALSDTVMEGNLQQDTDSVIFSKLLVETAQAKGAKLTHCFLSATGATANENALKMCFQKHHPAQRVLAFEGCFAGRTMALAQITDKAAYRVGLPRTLEVDYVPYFDPAQPRESRLRAVEALRSHIQRYPRQHAVMIVELIQGEGGYYPGDQDFFMAVLEILRENDVAILFDEIQTFGRTSEPFAFQHFGLDAYVDVVTVGKLTQACATLFREEYVPKPNLISQTFTSSTSALFAGRAILEELLQGGYFGAEGRIEKLHRHFVSRLMDIAARHPGWVNGPFGMGSMIAFTAFDGDAERTKQFLHALFEAGVIAFVAGNRPTRVRFLLPVGAVTPQQIDEVCAIVEKTLAQFG